jgi:hypothetical protein
MNAPARRWGVATVTKSTSPPPRRARVAGGRRSGEAPRGGELLTHTLRARRGGRDARGPHQRANDFWVGQHESRERPAASLAAGAWTAGILPARRQRSDGGWCSDKVARGGELLTHTLRARRGGRDARGPHPTHERRQGRSTRIARTADGSAHTPRANDSGVGPRRRRERPAASLAAGAWTAGILPARRQRSDGGRCSDQVARGGELRTHTLRARRGGRDARGPHPTRERLLGRSTRVPRTASGVARRRCFDRSGSGGRRANRGGIDHALAPWHAPQIHPSPSTTAPVHGYCFLARPRPSAAATSSCHAPTANL